MLKSISDKEDRLTLASKALDTFSVEVSEYKKGDVRHPPAYAMLLESRFRLSKDFAELVIAKASLGIVGKSWYKSL